MIDKSNGGSGYQETWAEWIQNMVQKRASTIQKKRPRDSTDYTESQDFYVDPGVDVSDCSPDNPASKKIFEQMIKIINPISRAMKSLFESVGLDEQEISRFARKELTSPQDLLELYLEELPASFKYDGLVGGCLDTDLDEEDAANDEEESASTVDKDSDLSEKEKTLLPDYQEVFTTFIGPKTNAEKNTEDTNQSNSEESAPAEKNAGEDNIQSNSDEGASAEKEPSQEDQDDVMIPVDGEKVGKIFLEVISSFRMSENANEILRISANLAND